MRLNKKLNGFIKRLYESEQEGLLSVTGSQVFSSIIAYFTYEKKMRTKKHEHLSKV